jgi:hypothetical protein
MSNALQSTLATAPAGMCSATHGAEQAVAATLGINRAMPPQPAQNFIARHRRGEFSLPRSFWINNILLSLGIIVILGAISYAMHLLSIDHPVVLLIFFGLICSANITFEIWCTIGTWRAATVYRRTGKRFWGAVTKAAMVLSTLWLVYDVPFSAIPHGFGLYELAAGDKGMGSHQFKVLSNGTVLDFSGSISLGTAKEFETMLNAMDEVRTVRLNSIGGRIKEAQKMSDLIRNRGLSTLVTHHCVSACTIVFLGGKDRIMHTTAKLGFHQPDFPGMTALDRYFAIAEERTRLQQFGLSKAFAERANTASPQSMWYPEQSELLREHVVTNIVTPPPKPVASKAPVQSAPVTRGIAALPATPTSYQSVQQ